MWITININNQLFRETRKLALESYKTLSSVIEEVLRHLFAMKNNEQKKNISLVTLKSKRQTFVFIVRQ